MRILIADNQPRARQSMKALLNAWHRDNELYEAADGNEAVRLAIEFKPDLILMDARMPKMGGLEAVKLIKSHAPDIRIIVLSMYPDCKDQALAAGADVFVSKSDPPERLRKTLEDVMRNISKINK